MLFRLQVKSRRDDRVYWTCAVRKCPSRATTREGILIGNSGHHTHEGNPLEVDSNRLKQSDAEDTETMPRRNDTSSRNLQGRVNCASNP